MIIHISSFSFTSSNEQRRVVTYLDGSPPTGDASQQAKAPSPNMTRKTWNAHSMIKSSDLGRAGVGLILSILDKAFKGEL